MIMKENSQVVMEEPHLHMPNLRLVVCRPLFVLCTVASQTLIWISQKLLVGVSHNYHLAYTCDDDDGDDDDDDPV